MMQKDRLNVDKKDTWVVKGDTELIVFSSFNSAIFFSFLWWIHAQKCNSQGSFLAPEWLF